MAAPRCLVGFSLFDFFPPFFCLVDSRDGREKDSSVGNNENENVLNTICASKSGYKYVEVVRGKDERAKLNGYKCRECQQVLPDFKPPQISPI